MRRVLGLIKVQNVYVLKDISRTRFGESRVLAATSQTLPSREFTKSSRTVNASTKMRKSFRIAPGFITDAEQLQNFNVVTSWCLTLPVKNRNGKINFNCKIFHWRVTVLGFYTSLDLNYLHESTERKFDLKAQTIWKRKQTTSHRASTCD